MDTQLCLGLRACRHARALRTTDGESICQGCGKRRETRRRRPSRRTGSQGPTWPSANTNMTGHPLSSNEPRPSKAIEPVVLLGVTPTSTSPSKSGSLGEDPSPRTSSPRANPTKVDTIDCPGCNRGKISLHHWNLGHRLCTSCKPLPIVAVGVHKSMPVILLAEDVTPDTVASGRRRP